jgi:molybdate transport system substrate-binding protein
MSRYKFKLLAIATAVSLIVVDCANAATTINVAVAANFAGTMASLVSAFKILNPTYNVTYTSDSSANLVSAIQQNTTKYDLFLSADTARPLLLQSLSLTEGSTFLYAYGTVEFYSATQNVSAGVSSSYTNILIADPTKSPYGFAASEVLQALGVPFSGWVNNCQPASYLNVSDTSTVPNTCQITSGGPLVKSENIGTTYSAIKSGVYPYGFVAQAQICKLQNGVKTFANINTHKTYEYNGAAPYHRVTQYGIRVKQSTHIAGSAVQTELDKFVAFLSSAQGKNIIKASCYDLPV